MFNSPLQKQIAEQKFTSLDISVGADKADKMDVRNCKMVTKVTPVSLAPFSCKDPRALPKIHKMHVRKQYEEAFFILNI